MYKTYSTSITLLSLQTTTNRLMLYRREQLVLLFTNTSARHLEELHMQSKREELLKNIQTVLPQDATQRHIHRGSGTETAKSTTNTEK